jgi:hypothetical protein
MGRLNDGYDVALGIDGVTQDYRQLEMLTLDKDEGIYKY